MKFHSPGMSIRAFAGQKSGRENPKNAQGQFPARINRRGSFQTGVGHWHPLSNGFFTVKGGPGATAAAGPPPVAKSPLAVSILRPRIKFRHGLWNKDAVFCTFPPPTRPDFLGRSPQLTSPGARGGPWGDQKAGGPRPKKRDCALLLDNDRQNISRHFSGRGHIGPLCGCNPRAHGGPPTRGTSGGGFFAPFCRFFIFRGGLIIKKKIYFPGPQKSVSRSGKKPSVS